MTLIRKLLLVTLTIGTLLGCSFGKSNSSDNRVEVDTRNRLSEKFALVAGHYTGTVESNPRQDVELSLYIIEVRSGKNSDGDDIFLPALKARFRRLASTQADIYMDARFIPETGDVFLSSTSSQPGQPGQTGQPAQPPTFTITARLTGDNLDGSVVKNGGTLGALHMRRIDNDASAPPEGDVEERNQRLRQLYAPLIGLYHGKAVFMGRGAETINFSMTIYIVDQPTADGYTIPILVSYYKRDNDPTGEVALTLDCTYSTDTTPPSISMESRPFPGPPNNYKITITGQVHGNTITGSFTNVHFGLTGDMTLTKIKSGAPATVPGSNPEARPKKAAAKNKR